MPSNPVDIAALSAKYDLRVPRYTSYPTAPHFQLVQDDSGYRQWLADLSGDLRPSLYVHIPFCDEMCWFCGCYTKIVKRHEPISDYLKTVMTEVDLVSGLLGTRPNARHLHFGGGSPTMLTTEEFAAVIGHIGDRLGIGADAEVAVELDPRTATEDYVNGLARAGVNRASIGVQDFHPEVQQAINRIQPADMTGRVMAWLQAAGITSLNMDLMYGLPFQTVDRVLEMVDQAVAMGPKRFALFGYAHVPWMKTHQKLIPEETLPGVEERWHQYEAAKARLLEHGYAPVGLDHFALPEDGLVAAFNEGRLHRNFQGYTTDAADTMLSFGASAIGRTDQGFVQNKLPLKGYREDVEAGRLPIGKQRAFEGDDKLRGRVIEVLMCQMEVDLDAVCAEFGEDAGQFQPELDSLAPLEADGLVTITGRKIIVPEAGRPLIRLAAAAFDKYLQQGQKRHSKAV